MNRSGMRWRIQGGQAVLTVRALIKSGRFGRAWAGLMAAVPDRPANDNYRPETVASRAASTPNPQASAIIAIRDSHPPRRGGALQNLIEIFVFEGGVAANQEGWREVINQALPWLQKFTNVRASCKTAEASGFSA